MHQKTIILFSILILFAVKISLWIHIFYIYIIELEYDVEFVFSSDAEVFS